MQTLMTTPPSPTRNPPPVPVQATSAPVQATSAPDQMTAAAGKIPSLFAGKAWQQVLARDPTADGQFVYAVKSTHIFCRPSCPSRRPTRKNVTFFPSPALAEAAGFRACKRCEPSLAAPRLDPQAQAIQAAAGYLSEHATERLRLDDVARATGVPRLTLLRGFKRVLGVSPGQFAKAQRLSTFKDRLKPSAKNPAPKRSSPRVTDAIYDAGFGSSSRLYEGSSATLGMTPTDLRRGAPARTIRYTIANSPLGRTLVAATSTGICAIAFASSDAVLRHDLRERFPQAELVEETAPRTLTPRQKSSDPADDPQAAWLSEAVRFVLDHLSENPTAATFPLDTRSTAFQHRVWQALQAIPRGRTLSYRELARSIGQPTAVRAVASACAANPLALAIPCHRVVGAKGALTGYRWGVDRKQQILAAETPAAGAAETGTPLTIST